MSNPGWPDAAALPFLMFGAKKPGESAAGAPLAQGLADGMDLVRKFWGAVPGGTALPGFLVPTLDVEELDKRISDLRAAESWIEVNLNMLRATVQGLEVQRNTIAAIQSLSAMSGAGVSGDANTAVGGPPAGWPGARVPPAPVASKADPVAPAAGPDTDPVASPDAKGDVGTAASAKPLDSMTSHWLGFMQEQFAKVAQAALSPVADRIAATPSAAPPPAAGKRAPRRTAAVKSASGTRGTRKKAGR